jgi:hypothetical protein
MPPQVKHLNTLKFDWIISSYERQPAWAPVMAEGAELGSAIDNVISELGPAIDNVISEMPPPLQHLIREIEVTVLEGWWTLGGITDLEQGRWHWLEMPRWRE